MSLTAANKLVNSLKQGGNSSQALLLQRFFKTGPGEYGEGDRFLGLKVPQTRAIVKDFTADLTIGDLDILLNNRWHEVRLAALVAMVTQFPKADAAQQKALFDLYLKQIGRGINNWDLVDISCPRIVGAYLSKKDHDVLYNLAKGDLWQKRVSIISTFWFLRQGEPGDTYNLAEILVYEKHDLLQKAVGWALREMGKLDDSLLEQFLDKYAASMPRTALRYALEKTPETKKRYYMDLKNEDKNQS